MSQPQKKKRHYPAVGPLLKKILIPVFGLFALQVVNSVYLVFVTLAGLEYQNWFYMIMFLLHLILGLALVVPVIVFGIGHIRNTRHRKNRRAVRAGFALFSVVLLVFISGFVLTRVDLLGIRFEVNNPMARSTAYWLHVISPLVVIWLFILHRLTGPKIRWKTAAIWAGVAVAFACVMLVLQAQDPRVWNRQGPGSGEQYFEPSLARTSTGDFIPEKVLNNDDYCKECHAEVHDSWAQSAHKFSSFNNPVYAFSVKNTRTKLMERDNSVKASRFCAGCHDPVPFFSGAFDDPKFDDPHYDLSKDRMANAGITCTACHAITHVNSPRGNSDFTITEPTHYPFTFSEKPFLKWVNRQLVKAKPEFHKATFLKPLHRSTEFCGSCHKVHLPRELNKYKWLRGQNHFDSFWLSGVSGQGIASFYYPEKAEKNCNDCHMKLVATDDRPNFSSRIRDESGELKTMDHLFPSANTALPALVPEAFDDPEATIAAHQAFNEGVIRLDIFGIRKGGTIDGELSAPLRPTVPSLEPGKTYLLETLIRTLKMGHHFTQGTADSNQVWLEATLRLGDQIIGQSGGMDQNGVVDPWSHFVNAFVIDRQGYRIDRRNAEDIFVALYDNQIPPGAADVVHLLFQVPADATGQISIDLKLRYRKFDTTLMRFVAQDPDYINELPTLTLAEDHMTFPIGPEAANTVQSPIPEWERWNDYGIALLRSGQLGELRQAKAAFERVESLGLPDGPLNLARVFIKEGLIQTDAPRALARANEMGANQWSLLWFGAQVGAQNGDYEVAIANLREIIRGGFTQAEGRNFDFSKDYRVQIALGNALYQRALSEQGENRSTTMQEARDVFAKALEYDPENASAHWGIRQVFRDLGDDEKAALHERLHAKYKPDDNVRDSAVAAARARYPAANRAAEAIVIYNLQRAGATESGSIQ